MKWLMEQLHRFGRAIRGSSPLCKAALAAAIVLSATVLLGGRMMLWDAQNRLEALQQQAAQLTAENQQIREDIDSLGSADSIRRIATEELGLVDPGTVVIIDSA